jgi:hypothetical protein
VTCERPLPDDALADLDAGDPHLASCSSCRGRREAFVRLHAVLASGASSRTLPPRWKERLMERARALPPAPVRRPRRRMWAAAAACAGAAAVIVVLIWPARPPGDPVVAFKVMRGTSEWRGDSSPGDDIDARGSAPGWAAAELRIYRNGRELVLRCPGTPAPACRVAGDEIAGRWRISGPGAYQIVLFAAPGALPAPRGTLDDDTRAVTAAGGKAMADSLRIF